MPLLSLLLALQTLPPPVLPQDAYADARAKELVTLARTRRQTVDRSIREYRVLAKERIGVGVRALRRDRMLYRREMVARIEWQRDSVGRVELLGARQTIPVAVRDPEIPDDLDDAMDLAFDPTADDLMIGLSDSSTVRHPLAPGSEADYRFASGDSTTLTFPDGRRLRLFELKVIPRRQDFRLMSGSLWLEEQEHAVVRLLFRPARPFDFDIDVNTMEDRDSSRREKRRARRRAQEGRGRDRGDDDGDVPGFMKPLRIDVRYVAVEYALWDQRWWLPRLLAVDATATAGSWLAVPVRFERLYADYEVTADSTGRWEPRPPARSDSAAVADALERCQAFGEDVRCECEADRCAAFRVAVPLDTSRLLVSPDLPPAFAGMGDSLMVESELRDLARELDALPLAPWQVGVRPPRWGLFRYNRVEALSLGAQLDVDLGRARLAALGRIGVGDWEPDVQLGLARESRWGRFELRGYRRLSVMDPATDGLGIGNSLAALLIGRDDGDYLRATGAELTALPPVTRSQRWALRLYVERQRSVVKETDFSVPHLFDQTEIFRSNLQAAWAEQYGLVLDVRTSRVVGAAGATVGADVRLEAASGDYAPIAGLAAGVEIAAGTSTGDVPIQQMFFLGGPRTLRGYGGATRVQNAFWRTRLEIANGFPGARIALFTDMGRAMAREVLTLRDPLIGVGVGASLLDGLFRIDVTRALVGPRGWRVDFYTDGML
jgi:hypothetical protein